ncbi:hypothetical protein CHUAL_003067 [Chamberlinius hualienensis]
MDLKLTSVLVILSIYGSISVMKVEAVVSNIRFEDCGSTAIIHRLWVEPCDPFQNGCHLYRNTNVTFNLQFQPAKSYESFQHQVTGIIFGARIPFNGVQGQACNRLVGQSFCPLQAGQIYDYVNNFGILRSYPRIPVTIEYRLRAASGEDLVCFLMESKISNRPQ